MANVDSPVQTWTVYDGANAYADFDGAGNVTMRYLFGLGVDEPVRRGNQGGWPA